MKIPGLLTAILLPALLAAQKAPLKPASPKSTSPKSTSPYAQLDARALKLPDSATHAVAPIAAWIDANFSTPTERTRAIFAWIAGNIDYDVVNMFALNFSEHTAAKIARALQTRKGICENYAALFTAVCNAAGIASVVVEGYTKQRGFTDYIPHAWSAAQLDGVWYLFDPTWGSGYIEKGQFVRKMNDGYFKATPESFIATHMPFDYLWEFLYYPVTTEDFYNGNTQQNLSRPRFNYPDSLKAYEAMAPVDREAAAADRIERNGVRNTATFNMIGNLRIDVENHRRQAETDRQNRLVDAYNTALGIFNESLRQFNVFINYLNAQFKPERPDGEIRRMLDSADHLLQAGRSISDTIRLTPADNRIDKPLQQLRASMTDLGTRIKEEQDWLTKYLSKGKSGRRSMFYKYTWFGVPLN
jgi:Transglutaminase-like superfamily